MKKSNILKVIKKEVLNFEPNSKIILYGSRVRGDFTYESDWDLLILLTKPVDFQRKLKLKHKLYEIEVETGEVISTIIHSVSEWESERNKITPFYQNVMNEGIEL